MSGDRGIGVVVTLYEGSIRQGDRVHVSVDPAAVPVETWPMYALGDARAGKPAAMRLVPTWPRCDGDAAHAAALAGAERIYIQEGHVVGEARVPAGRSTIPSDLTAAMKAIAEDPELVARLVEAVREASEAPQSAPGEAHSFRGRGTVGEIRLRAMALGLATLAATDGRGFDAGNTKGSA